MMQTEQRKRQLRFILEKTLSGQQTLKSPQSIRLFLEAICCQDDPALCIERLISSQQGLSTIQYCFQVDPSISFLNGLASQFLQYIQDSGLRTICNGSFLQRVVLSINKSRVCLDSFVDAYENRKLDPIAEQSFAWMLLQLISLPLDQAREYLALFQTRPLLSALLGSSQLEVRLISQKIKHILETLTNPGSHVQNGPGGRHDNDFADFREISILPTLDELESKESPFLRRLTEIESCPAEHRLAMHLDNQFRLLREDILRNLREDLQIATNLKKGHRKPFTIHDLRLSGVNCREKQPWALQFICNQGIRQLSDASHSARLSYIKDNRKFLAHDSLACLVAGGNKLLALVTVLRDEDLLAARPPVVCLQPCGPSAAIVRTLIEIKKANNIQLVLLNTAVFAYQPVLLQLQKIRLLDLKDQFLNWESGSGVQDLDDPKYRSLEALAASLNNQSCVDISRSLDLKNELQLDASQIRSFISSIKRRVSLIQGPPGTGKSIIGALVAKAIHQLTKQKILVVCYTNHALDQFLEDLIDIGISREEMVRLGSARKSSSKIEPLVLSKQNNNFKLTRVDWEVIDSYKAEVKVWESRFQDAFREYAAESLSKQELMEHLEFMIEDPNSFHEALSVPEQEDGMILVGNKGKAVDKYYLLNRWAQGKDAGIFLEWSQDTFPEVWKIQLDERKRLLAAWREQILRDRVAKVGEYGDAMNRAVMKVNEMFSEKDRKTIEEKRIIGCTTTAAAKYVQYIQSARPEVLLVEEAGEILESHILTAMGPHTEQLILIGDHKQLRPKAHYDLSVEKNDGFDLNRSMFERLVLRGYPHEILTQQHRMRPEISDMIRQLTYPDLVDAPSTLNRAELRGFQDNLIFVTHENLEEDVSAPDWRDGNSTSSKKNKFEAQMILKCVKYLAQQGYRSDQVVVLTPYLAQLRLLMDVLRTENDPVLNDMDSHDLIRAGLMPEATAAVHKNRLRISTVDNYQGEESDIVLVSLTRSNTRGDIGFLSSPERLNVLISRARDALIMVGNAKLLSEARKGRELWSNFFKLLKAGSHIYDGFPVKCERHPGWLKFLCQPEDFNQCPDGGCDQPCKSLLRCGLHPCPQSCHQLFDHSKMACEHVLQDKCDKGHQLSWKCSAGKLPICKTCKRENEAIEARLRAEIAFQEQKEEEVRQHAKSLAIIEQELAQVRLEISEKSESQKRKMILTQKRRDLEEARKLASQLSDTNHTADVPITPPGTDKKGPSQRTRSRPTPRTLNGDKIASDAEHEWLRQKTQEGASNDALDTLMKMTGLEEVKAQFLKIKVRLETSKRQNNDFSTERLGVVLLGNPGTGKTTVARLYAKFLTSVGALPGLEFVETTGSRLANEGVGAAKKQIESVLTAGGGAIFIDEAYQLALGHNQGGAAVMDFLLAEIENQVGKIVFILAGYDKQMEKFFEHNQGFDSRIPHRLRFADYTDDELVHMLSRLIDKRYNGKMKVEDGSRGLYLRIAARRVGRGRGREGFGNARALENALSKMADRQAERLQKDRTAGQLPDDFLLTKSDIIGPDPSEAILESTAWTELQGMVGLAAVKEAVRSFLDRVQTNYRRELDEKPLIEVSLNRLFLGPPGTGKTSVGKLYGQILADIGLIPSSEVVVKDPSDMIGAFLGESEKLTKNLLKATEGKVLIIDEAYMLGSGQESSGGSDIYRMAAVDTLVSQIQSTPGEPRCVIMLGYREQMEEMFQKVNPGLSRRFPIEDAFNFEDFNNDELRQILDFKLHKQALQASDEAKITATAVLSKLRRRPNFGNAGEVENLLTRAKENYQKRQSKIPVGQRPSEILFEPHDFDVDFDRGKNAIANCRDIFKDVIGCEEMVDQFESMIRSVENMRSRGLDPEANLSFNYIFRGPPGTGKTQTARKMGQIFFDMGILASKEVHECSATDLVGQYVGHTGPKTQKLLEKALGKVLFIDEAYRLCDGPFAKEAIDELVDCLTKPKFKGKILVVLAGYDDDINRLLSINPGLSSRFPEVIVFRNMKPSACYQLLKQNLHQKGLDTDETVTKDLDQNYIINLFERLSSISSWGNGRDVSTLAQNIMRAFFTSVHAANLDARVSLADIATALESFLRERQARASTSNGARGAANKMSQQITLEPLQSNADALLSPPEPQTRNQTERQEENKRRHSKHSEIPSQTASTSLEHRDPGVSDAIWEELEEAKANQQRVEAEGERVIRTALNEADGTRAELDVLEKQQEEETRATLQPGMPEAGDHDAGADEAKRRHEALRLKILRARQKAWETEEKMRKTREREEQRRKEEAKAQKKLREMGVCPAGFRWFKVGSGWRCGGGSHWVDDAALGL